MPDGTMHTLDQRRREIWKDVRLENFTYSEVAAKYGVTRSVAHDDVRIIEQTKVDEWRAEVDELRSVHIAMYRQAAAEAWGQWRESKGRVEQIKTAEQIGDIKKTKLVQKEMQGAVHYLRAWQANMQAIEKITIGMYAPAEAPGGTPLFTEADRIAMTNVDSLLATYGRRN